jgi:hypothetical protein
MNGPVSLSTLLDRMAGELRQLEARISNLERAFGEVALESHSPRSPRFHELQEIDRIRQEVGGIADFLSALAIGVPVDCRADALTASQKLGLEALAAALGHGEAREVLVSEYEPFD